MENRTDWQMLLYQQFVADVEEAQHRVDVCDAQNINAVGQSDMNLYTDFHEDIGDYLAYFNQQMEDMFEINLLIDEYNKRWDTNLIVVEDED
jgi:hypothetical protein